jgi:putative ABC transport system permease protein
MSTLFLDFKVAVRHLLKSPGFAITAVLMLALGIGATTAIFSIVEGVLLRPLPFPQPDRLMVLADILDGAQIGSDNDEAGVTVPDIRNYVRDTHSFASLGGYQGAGFELSGTGEPTIVNGTRMSGGVLPALGVAPLMGRVFTQEEDEQHQQVTVLSYATWQSRFQGDPNILGRKILLDRKPFVVIGVMPRNFEFPLQPGHLNRSELWVPISFTKGELDQGSAANWSYSMVGRLKPEVPIAQAVDDAGRVAKETIRNYPAFMKKLNMHPTVRPLHEETVEGARPLVRTLFLAVAVVLLIACANLAGLLLVRAIRNRREIAVRLALGASGSALLRQMLLESLVLSVTGGIVGLVLAAVALRVGLKLLPETLPRLNEIGLDWQVVAFALSVAVLTGVVCGLAPAFAAIRTNVNDTLKEGGRTGTSGGHARLRSALVVGEIAVAMVLLAASGLLLRSFEKMRQVDLGYRPDHTLVAAYNLPREKYGTQAVVDEFNHELERRLQQLPGVKSAGITSFLPASGNNTNSVYVAEGYVPPKNAGYELATTIQVEGDYLQSMGVPLIRGRYLTADDKVGAQLVVVVNRKLAEHAWAGQDPIGKRLRIGTAGMTTPWAVVVGEVEDVKENSPDVEDKKQYYMTVGQTEAMAGVLASPTDINGNGGYIAVRTAMPPEQMENTLRTTVKSIDAQLPLTQVQTMEHAISETEAPRRFNTALISSFAAIAVLLAVLGIYSVIAFSVALRVQEMAIRMALGSQRTGIVGLVVGSGLKLALTGCAIGVAGAWAAAQTLQRFLFGVRALDPVTLALAAAALLLLTVAACLLPAWRAASVELSQALRAE